MAKQGVASLFLDIVEINEDGWTDKIFIKDLVKIDPRFASNNGCQWARKGSSIDKKYNLRRYHANELGGKGNRVVAIQLQGFRSTIENHAIPMEVRKALANKPCCVLGVITSDMEIDHKNGKYNSDSYTINDFQPMTKAVNDAKREHCKRCNACGIRFDAKTLGYPKSYIKGDSSSNYCEGCYWYDPVVFRNSL